MKTAEEIRKQRLAMLKEEFKTLAVLNERLGLDRRDSTLSQLLNGAAGSRTGKPKQMGGELARSLERACEKERGWMDNDPELTGEAALSAEARQLARDFDALSERQKRTLRTLWTAFIRDAVADADVAEHLPAAPLEIDLTRSPKPPKRRSA